MKKLFTNDRFIFALIVVNVILLFLQESGVENNVLNTLDALCTILFLIEMIVKQQILGVARYWKQNWNKLDGTLVILSLPSLICYFIPTALLDVSFLLALRVLRVFRFFRLVHVFPNFKQITSACWRAVKSCFGIFLGFFIIVFIFALISSALFRNIAPDYFGNPLLSIYSIFQICTVEGWYEIPNAVAIGTSPFVGVLIKLFFILILIAGGIIGLSLVNSIFVDEMVSDNNDELKKMVENLKHQLDEITDYIKRSKN